MSRTPFRFLWLAPAALVFLAGCVTNPYKRNYTSQLPEKVPRGEVQFAQGAAVQPKLLTSTDIGKDAVKLLEKGYYPLGRAAFREQLIDGAAALEQAQAVGADLVLVKKEHAGTGTYNMPVGDWSPDRSITTTEAVRTTNADGTGGQVSERESTTIIPGVYETHYELQTIEYYDHTAVFWKKVQPPRFGAYVSDLEDADRQAIQSNKGVVIRAVVSKSPAFLADLFRGDILVRFDDEDILDVDDYLDKVAENAGKAVDVTVWRAGKPLTKRVTLGAR